MKSVLITQSNYIPWKGYFDNIAQCDVFVIFDDAQYTRRDWRNRNHIKTPQGRQWLTIPVQVKGNYHQKINEIIVSEEHWNEDHWTQIKQNYSRSTFFKELSPWVEDLYHQATYSGLTDINIHFLKAFCVFLGIRTQFRDSREFSLPDGKTERLIAICKELEATDYYTGPAAKSYINEHLFKMENINVHYFDYAGYEEYSQLYPPFEHSVSILDLIFNVGVESKNYLKTAL